MIDFSTVTDILLGASVVEQIADSLGNILWSASAETDEYFWIENLTSSNMTVTIKKTNTSAPTVVLYRSSDKTTWTSMGNSSVTGRTATVPGNSKMYFKATTSVWSTVYYSNYITTNANCKIGGNIMSLIYGDNYKNQTTLTNSYALTLLFYNFTTLTDASELKLPATTLSLECYRSMFYGCTSLTTAPELPATTLANNCYNSMFYGCTSLTTAPELPATTLVTGCYSTMFYGCTSLTTAPELPATTLVTGCYSTMFQNCSNLNYVKTYAEDISATNCLNNWLDGVANSGTFFNEGNATYPVDSSSGIPQGWTEHKPLANYFYLEDISGSANTVKIKQNNASAPSVTLYKSTDGTNWTSIGTTSTSDLNIVVPANSKLYLKCTTNTFNTNRYNYFYTSTGRFNIGGNIMSLIYGDDFEGKTTFKTTDRTFYYLFNGNTNLVNAGDLILPATTMNDYCYFRMFAGCTSLTTAPATLPATTLANICYSNMFRDCTALTTAPTLPATTLVEQCYSFMFYGCSNLNRIVTYANNISATKCINSWVSGVAAQGEFYNLGSATYSSGASGIPTGWTVHTSL